MKKITVMAIFLIFVFAVFAPVFLTVVAAKNVSKPLGRVCVQVITFARSISGECRQFSSPCDIPKGWKIVDSCSSQSENKPTMPVPAEISDLSEDDKKSKDTLENSLARLRFDKENFKKNKQEEDREKANFLKEKSVSKKKMVQERIETAKKNKENKRKEILIHLIELEIKHFNNIGERVAQIPNLNIEIKSRLKAETENAVKILTDQKAKIRSATGDEIIKKLVQETKELFKKHREIVRKIISEIQISRENHLISRAEDRVLTIEKKINEIKSRGKNTSELEAVLVDARRDIDLAKEKSNQKLFKEANDLLKNAYDKFKSIVEKSRNL